MKKRYWILTNTNNFEDCLIYLINPFKFNYQNKLLDLFKI